MHTQLRAQLMSLLSILAIVALLPGSAARAATPEDARPVLALADSSGLAWNTFLGDRQVDAAREVVVDAEGNLYVVGDSQNPWGCATTDCTVREFSGASPNQEAYVAKLDPAGNLVWNTFLGGAGGDHGYDIARDPSGNLYIAGSSTSAWGCAVPADCTVRDYAAYLSDAFVAKLDSSGNLIWNTFLGSTDGDSAYGITVDDDGSVFAEGYSQAPWGSPLRDYAGGGTDTFVAKLDASGALAWNTFLGGPGSDWGSAIALDGSGAVHVVGYSDAAWSCGLSDCTAQDYVGQIDGFAAKLDPTGDLIWNTFTGGSSIENSNELVVDNAGAMYVAGNSESSWGSPIRPHADGIDASVSKIDSSGNLVWNTFLGGGADDWGQGVALDSSGNVYVLGSSYASWGAPVYGYTADADSFIAMLDPSGGLAWNTFLGGDGSDAAQGMALGSEGTFYVVGISLATWGAPVRAFYNETDPANYPVEDGFVAAWFLQSAAISGNAGLAGVTINYGDAATTSDDNGDYSIRVPLHWSGTVTPSHSGHTFSPDYREYSDVTTDQAGQDYIAVPNITYTISGNVGVAGATIDYSGGTTTATLGGDYSFTVLSGWSGIVTPSREGYAFAPDHRDYSDVISNQTFQDYQAASIGPRSTWNTFLGDAGIDTARGMVTDNEGNLYVVGDSQNPWGCSSTDCTIRDFTGAYPYRDAYVAKLDPSGNLLWNTFLGSGSTDMGTSIVRDQDGNFEVSGSSWGAWSCADTDCTIRAHTGGNNDAFVAKLDPSGNLIWNTFLGGSASDSGYDIALDSNANIYTEGYSSAEWGSPLRGYAGGSMDTFVAKLSPSGQVAWNTFLGGSGGDWGWGIGVDADGAPRVVGYSTAPWSCAFADCTVRDYAADFDAFAAKLDPAGHLQWNTFLGGSGYDDGFGLVIDASGATYVVGASDNSWGIPVRAHDAYGDTFVSKLDSTGDLVWNTFLGGSSDDWGDAITVDRAGNVYVAGESYASWGTPLRSYAADDDAFVAQLDPDGGLIWNTFLGGDGQESAMSVLLGNDGTVYAGGTSRATWGAPVRAFNTEGTNLNNAFVAALAAPPRISGNAGIGGATLIATGGYETTSDAAGNYSLAVPYDWSGTVTPAKAGYTFTPDHLDYSSVTTDQPSQDFTAEMSNYIISGNAGVGGATVSATGGLETTTDDMGSYSLTVPNAWSGTVTVSKAGYTFTPDHRDYASVTANQTGQDYTATLNTYIISGNAGIGGATIDYTGGSTTSDEAGQYSFTVSYAWSGTVTPSRTGYTFSPDHKAYATVTADQADQDYTATLNTYVISGHAGLGGVTISYDGGSTTADDTGYYSFRVPFDWSGAVTPSMDGYTFSPDHRDYSGVTADQPAQDYVAMVAISGNAGVADATLSATGGYEAAADAAGDYSIAVPYDWSGSVMPTKAGYTFAPDHLEYANVIANQTGQDYTATLNTYTICGNVGVQKVTLTATGDTSITATSDKDGNYCLTVPYNWSGTVAPFKKGALFSPESLSYVGVTSDQSVQDFIMTHGDGGPGQ